MAGIFLSRVGLLMGRTTAQDSGGGSSSGEVEVAFDATFAGPGHTLSNADRTLVNTSGGSDYRWWVPTTRALPGGYPVAFYWEVETNPGGPAQFNGYLGVVSQAQLDDPAYTHDSGQNPIHHGSVAYRGDGEIRGNTGTRLGSYTAHGAGDIVMMAVDPATGALWVGPNGVWETSPETGPPNAMSTAVG